MERKEFLNTLKNAAIVVCGGGCLASCVKITEIPNGSSVVKLTVNLNTELLKVGDSINTGPIAIIRLAPGNAVGSFAVLSTRCPHQGYDVQYFPDLNTQINGEFRCQGHGSRFTQKGNLIAGPAPGPLTALPFTVTANQLIVE